MAVAEKIGMVEVAEAEMMTVMVAAMTWIHVVVAAIALVVVVVAEAVMTAEVLWIHLEAEEEPEVMSTLFKRIRSLYLGCQRKHWKLIFNLILEQ